jgi:hypothetical protein
LADADFARKPSDAASGVNGSLKAIITHVDPPIQVPGADFSFTTKR